MKAYLTCCFVLLLGACSPSPAVIQTALAQTQSISLSATYTEQQFEQRLETALSGTLSAWSATTAATIQAVADTQTALLQTYAAQPTNTPQTTTMPEDTPLPTLTSTPPPTTPRPTLAPTLPPIIPSGPITITNAENIAGSQVRLYWQAEGSFVEGLVITWSKSNLEPAYPDNLWIRVAGSSRSAVIEVSHPDTYTFRVCEYKSNPARCENYSNAFTFTVY
ncbi:MAG: hypothetical protein HPY45_09655 [Anaerolineae bacterium]|nr:hypothetical protein [Anaerolineae bacterium]